MNTITIQFCEEDRKRIDELIAFAGLLAGELKSRPVGTTETAVLQSEGVSVGLPVEGAAHLEPVIVEEESTPAPIEEAPAPEVKPVSLAEFQKAITLAVSRGAEAKQAVKSIINKYAPSVSGVPEDKRAEVIAELSKI
jgi:hypothetical protein